MGSILNEGDRAEIDRRLRSLSATSTRAMGQHGRSGHASAPSTVGTHDSWRAVGAFGKQARVPGVSAQAPHSLRVSLPEGSANGARVEARDAASFEEERAAVLELLERIGTGHSEGVGPAHPLFGPLTLARMGRGHVQTHRSSSKQFGV